MSLALSDCRLFLLFPGKEVGSVLTTVTANDVDTNPALTYNISSADGSFSIDRFSGKVTLCQKLDFETKKEYKIGITASDTAHVAHTHLTIIVSDDNDNIPIFSQQYYHAYIPGTCYPYWSFPFIVPIYVRPSNFCQLNLQSREGDWHI